MIYDFSKHEDKRQWVKNKIKTYEDWTGSKELRESILDSIVWGIEMGVEPPADAIAINRIEDEVAYVKMKDWEDEEDHELIENEDELKSYGYVIKVPYLIPYKSNSYRLYIAEEADGWTGYIKKE